MERQDMQWGYKHLKKMSHESKEKRNFPEAKPLLLQFDVFLIVLYIIYDFTFTQLDCTTLQTEQIRSTGLWQDKRLYLFPTTAALVTLLRYYKKGLHLNYSSSVWQDSKHCRSFQTLKDNEQEVSSAAFRYLQYRNIHSTERCKDII